MTEPLSTGNAATNAVAAVAFQGAWKIPRGAWVLPDGAGVVAASAERDVWLQARRDMICASDLAALVGVSKYGDSYTVWADKRGLVPPSDGGSNAMRRGQLFEDAVIELWAERYAGFPIALRRQGLVRSKRWEHAGATVDRLSVCPDGRCVVEAKTQVDIDEWLGDEVPVAYQLQGQWQLFVTGRDHVHFVVLGPRLVPIHRVMMRDDELCASLLARCVTWWDHHVDGDVTPTPTHLAADVIRQRYGNPERGARFELADPESADLFEAATILKADLDATRQQYEGVLAQLQDRVGNATEIYRPGEDKPVASWRPTKTIDGATDAWKLAHQELVELWNELDERWVLDTAGMVAAHPELIESGELRYRRSWLYK